MKQIKFSIKLAYHGAKGHVDSCLAWKTCLYSLEGEVLASVEDWQLKGPKTLLEKFSKTWKDSALDTSIYPKEI